MYSLNQGCILINPPISIELKEKVDQIQKETKMYRSEIIIRATELFIEDYQKGNVEIDRQIKRGPKKQIITEVPVELSENLDLLIKQLNENVEVPIINSRGRNKKMTKGKLITQVLEHWIEKEGYANEQY